MADSREIEERLRRAKGFVLDMDGTLVLGDAHNRGLRALPGAAEFIAHLKDRNLPFVSLTNGTVRPPGDYVHELAQAGIELTENQIMTPASVAAEYLSRRRFKRVMAMGGAGVSAPLARAGLEIVRPPERENIDAIFIGWFREFGMADIEAACDAVWSGAKVYAASLVPFFATAGGRTLGTSCAIAGAIAKITGRHAIVLGKPSREALGCASRRLGIATADLAVIGDDPALEPLMALRGGAFGIGVTSGVATPDDFHAMPDDVRAHLVVPGIGEFLKRHRAALGL